MFEVDLRRWLKKVWGLPRGILWIEPGRGSSVGVPDVMLDVFGTEYWLPIELKIGSMGKLGDKRVIKVRPAQRRFHRIAYEEGRRTAFMILAQDKNEGWLVYVAPGNRPGSWNMLDHYSMTGLTVRENMIQQLNDLEFWGTECLGQLPMLLRTQS